MLINKRIPLYYIFNKIKYDVLAVIVIGLVVHYLTTVYQDYIPVMPITIPAFVGTAISVILSFKLNQSYDRWWEARKIWGSIVNESRNFVLQLQSFLSKEQNQILHTMAYRQIAWCYSLGQSLRSLDATANLEPFLSENDLNHIKTQSNKPLAIMQLNTNDLTQLKDDEIINIFSHIQLNNTQVNLVNAMGMAERIKSTVFPVTYRKFLHLFIFIFVVTLSIALQDIESYFELPLLLTLSSAFFLLEASATHLQDPFMNRPTDTAMTTIARTIEINIKELLGDTNVPKPLPPHEFYAM